MKQIPLTQGLFALVNDDDFERLSHIKWHARKSRKTFYAEANAKNHHKNGGTIRKKKKQKPPMAFHAKKGEAHAVLISDIKVLILNNDSSYFAQGLDIDYCSQGKDLNQAKEHFENGLSFTIHEHLKSYGNIEKLLKVAPSEYWDQYYKQVSTLVFTLGNVYNVENKINMHNLILNPPEGIFVDHKNGNGLDNQRSNLRYATASQNQCNRGKQKNSTSGFKGVHKDKGFWRAEIRINRKMKNLGRFENSEDASKAYDKAAKRYHGEFAYSNN